jgi:acyl transferase domain-containing protein/D-arabinose 1-dehydrogenase-like Zn-dependent alcohol dehydrogenase/acyl carrier protein/NAD(P)-dependent dehydrogenase (short-subunit alcohol dehydrogenase family)/SAM-dependent methyltransferase
VTRKHILEALRNGQMGVEEARRAVRLNGGATPQPAPAAPSATVPAAAARTVNREQLERLETELVRSLAAALYTDESEIALDRNFKDLGLDSIVSVEWINSIKRQYGIKIPATKVYDYPTIQQFAAYLGGLLPPAAQPVAVARMPRRETPAAPAPVPAAESRPAANAAGTIAIVGMSGRYPGAANLAQFWENLRQGRNSIREIPRERWDVNAYFDADPGKPGKVYCRWLGALDGIDRFDAPFFMISPAEAEAMDPQYRIFLEQAYQAFEDAGYSAQSLSNRRCGVYMGVMNSEYVHLLAAHQMQTLNTGNSHSIAAARVSYFLNLKGPAMPIDTACSSSLVATHLACQALRNGEIEMALVGGVTLYLTAASYIGMCAAGMLSADGQCKSFDNDANGFVPGEGAGTLVLKRLEDAQRDHDCIHGVILGSGINQDGRTNGITAPSVTSQIELERDVYRRFGIDPATIDYIEAHGTGTKLGDPVELEALTTVFRERTKRRAFCGLGSVKSNIGHTSAAAGMAGVQKMLLCFKHRTLVPTLNFRAANTHCDFEDSPFYVNTEAKSWPARDDVPRRAAISSMGFSGTNAHVVIEEYTGPVESRSSSRGPHAIVLSARNEARLVEAARNLRTFLRSGQHLPPLQDIAYTLQTGRDAMEERLGLIVASVDDLVAKLEAFLDGRTVAGLHRGRVQRVKGKLVRPEPDAAMAQEIMAAIARGEWSNLLERWVNGLVFDWNQLYREERPYRVSLPTYPFAPERYWVSAGPAAAPVPVSPAATIAAAAPAVTARDLGDGVHALQVSGASGAQPSDEAIVDELVRALGQVRERPEVKAVIMTGDERAFLGAEAARPAGSQRELAERVVGAVRDCEVPVIAVLKGRVAGLGLAVANACDFVVCAETCEFSASDAATDATREGIRLRFESAGDRRAVTGADWRKRGAGFPVVPLAEADARALQLAREIAQAPRPAIALLKRHLARIAPAAGAEALAGSAATENLWREATTAAAPDPGRPAQTESVSPAVKFEVFEDGVVLLTLQETESKNAFSPVLAQGVADCFQRIRGNAAYKVVVLTGYGNYFACGGTKEALVAIQEGRAKFTDLIVSSLPLDCEIPVIAAMQGHGIGAGWSLGLFCDYAAFSAESRYHSPYLSYGFTPGAGATLVLPERLGGDLGREVLFSAREYPGHELAARGLKHPVWPRAEVLPRALQLAHWLARSSRDVLVAQKTARSAPLRSRLQSVYAQEVAMHEQTFVGNGEVSVRLAKHFGAPESHSASNGSSASGDASTQTPWPNRNVEKPTGLTLKTVASTSAFSATSVARPQPRALPAPAAYAAPGAPSARAEQPDAARAPAAAGSAVLKPRDVLNDLKSAVGAGHNMVPTLNRTGVMLEKLTPTSTAFAEYAGQCRDEVLDIGCAYGVATIAALERGASVLAVDMEPQHLEILEARIAESIRPRLRTQRGVLPEVEFAAGRFAAIHAARVIHFLRPEEVQQTIRKMFAWLRPGGRLFLVSDTPYVGYWKSKARDYEARKARGDTWPGYINDVARDFAGADIAGAPPLINALDPDVLRRECLAAGFEVEKAGFEDAGISLGTDRSPPEGREHAGIVARKPAPARSEPAQPSSLDPERAAEVIRQHLKASLAEALHTRIETVDEDMPFIELGVDSVISVTWVRGINTRYGLSIGATRIYDYPSVRQFAEFLRDELQKSGKAVPALPVENQGTPARPVEKSEPRQLPPNYGLVLSKVHVFGELTFARWDVPPPAPTEVTIAVKASALSFTDTICVRGLFPAPYPFVPGFEVAGIVTAVGSGVSDVRVGDEVVALTGGRMGAHAASVNVPGAHVVAKPRRLSFEDACSLPLAFGATFQALERLGRLAPGERVLIHTATGGCGLMALQIARLKGCLCHASSSRAEKRALLQRLGVSHVFDYTSAEFGREIRRSTDGRGVDVVLNTVAGQAIQQGLDCLAPSGRYLELATHALLTSPKLDLSNLRFNQSIQVIAFFEMLSRPEAGTLRETLAQMAAWAEAGLIVPTVSRIYPLRQIAAALEYVSAGQHVGKVVISHTAETMEDRLETCIAGLAEQKQRADRAAQKPERTAPAVTIAAPPRREQSVEGIAIIGMSGRFPKSPTLAAFWENIAAGRSCISEIPASRWPIEKFYDPDPTRSGKTCSKWMGVLEDVDRFDPLFFQISPAEARLMDPQQRLFIEACWSCVEDAGINPRTLSGSNCGVFAGCGMGDYGLTAERGGVIGTTGVAPSILPARISYLLNLKGPSLAIDTACSASLVAVANACDSLILGNCDLALAGGVLVMTGPSLHVGMSQGGMLSPDGRCFTFDDRANGFVPGEGVGVVLLKRLSDAVRDGDQIHGVVRGWGVNQDGKTNGITAPSMTSQLALERGVYERFGVNPETISLVEAHGTGTRLGDPIEVEALIGAFRGYTRKPAFCALGSVKSNIGHLGVAAGVAGLLKVLLALRHRTLPPTINFATLNPHIPLEGSPFFVSETARAWETEAGRPRRATVSSFGFSGTNAHLVIEEAPAVADATPVSGPAVVVLSAKTEAALRDTARDLAAFLSTQSTAATPSLADIAYTLQVGREPMGERLGLLVDSPAQLLEGLNAFLAGRTVAGLYRDQVKRNKEAVATFLAADKASGTLEQWIRHRNLAEIVGLWVKGLDLDWRRLYPNRKPNRVSLPSYPFARERHWALDAPVDDIPAPSRESAPSAVSPTLLARPFWRARPAPTGTNLPAYERHVIFACGFGSDAVRKLAAEFPSARCLPLPASAERLGELFAENARQAFEVLREMLGQKSTGRTLVQAVVASDGAGALMAALSGLFKTARLENPKLVTQVIETDASEPAPSLRQAATMPDAGHLRFHAGTWAVPAMEELGAGADATPAPWKDGGIYLITGGAGGLGLIFANEIATQAARPTLILAGRSSLDATRQRVIAQLAATGAAVVYRQVQVADAAAVDALVQHIHATYGKLDGVLHAAGVIRDNFILKKTAAEFLAVLAPKVAGTVNLDHATRDLPLDCFVLFSSGAGATGNAGQADYATANAFMDAFAVYRRSLVEQRSRAGRTVSINWPLWQEGGMCPDAATLQVVRETTGMAAMDTAAGLRAFYRALATSEAQVMVAAGDLAKIRTGLRAAETPPPPKTPIVSAASADVVALRERTLAELKRLLGAIVDLPVERIESDEPLESYGIDSLMVTRLNQQLTRVYPELSQTLFFEHQTLAAIAGHLVEAFTRETMLWLRVEPAPSVQPAVVTAPPTAAAIPAATPERAPVTAGSNPQREWAKPGLEEPIAIVGICGRYAQADTLAAFWENLKAGKDCVTEIPSERWSLDGFFHPDPAEAIKQGKSYSKWGSFLGGFADFDPLFFHISPREALGIDPHERLFLQASWEVLETAGYTRSRLAETIDGDVGVFVGITKTGFDQYRTEWQRQGETAVPYTSFGSVANRVSYLLNLKGPSMPIDTMCSSSLTAIHEACEHLRRGSCRMAIAGGVNLYLHPSSYVGLCAQRMLSRDGQCKSFGADGNGFVPGEGVGAVLLKPLAQAIADGDPIHAIIRGTSVNHGGKTNGYTVPNPNAHRDLIRAALAKSGVDARSVSYIEAHGTGTELGDPIEVTGLTQAFAPDTTDTGFCALGSVKSNLGHLEAAAGIAGLTKVVLQLKHRMLAPSLHAAALNPKIPFNRTPFVVQQALGEWPRPVVGGSDRPRIAGISSFGAGGSNAHIIVEEPPAALTVRPSRRGPALVVLSAKTEERLQAYARELGAFLRNEHAAAGVDLHELAFTLQTGREAMQERVAFVVSTPEELRDRLAAFVEHPENGAGCIRGRVQRGNEGLADFYGDEDMVHTIAAWLRKGKLARVAELWLRGATLDWRKLYGDDAPRRVVLPTYPFARERYWVDVKRLRPLASESLHPMVHANTSDLSGLRFTSRFGGDEFFVADHVVQGERVLPGVAYLEMARFAALRAASSSASDHVAAILRHVVWVRPVSVPAGGVSVHLRLAAAGKDGLSFSVESAGPAGEATVRCQGFVLARPAAEAPVLELSRLQVEIAERRMSGPECYTMFAALGLSYGQRFQAIETIAVGAGQALARVVLPSAVTGTQSDYGLHPSLLDAALQACIGLARFDRGDENATFVPYAIDEVEVMSASPARVWVWIRPSGAGTAANGAAQKLDLDVVDDTGRVCVALRGLAFRRLDRGAERTNQATALLLAPEWVKADVPSDAPGLGVDRWTVLACGVTPPAPEVLAQFCPGAVAEEFRPDAAQPVDRFLAAAAHAYSVVRQLLREGANRKQLLQIVVPAEVEAPLLGGLAGLLKTARLENRSFIGQLIMTTPEVSAEGLARRLSENGRSAPDVQIRHDRDGREVLAWRELSVRPAAAPWKEGGVYLITGGTGGLGRIFAQEIARQAHRATVILCGRSALDPAQQAELRALERNGTRVVYRAADVVRREDVRRLITEIQAEHGTLHGVLHAAGVIRDHLVVNKTAEEFGAVLMPKVAGTANLDEATQAVALDFFILFSAGAGVFGNPGQADYATANAFLDEFARYRNRLVAAGQRRGTTLSVDWPLWESGGMKMNEAAITAMKASLGLVPLATSAGIDALGRAFASGADQVLVANGEPQRLRSLLTRPVASVVAQRRPVENPAPGEAATLEEKAVAYFRSLLSSTLRVPEHRIQSDGVMSDLGLDSVVVMGLTNRLEQTFGALSKTLFFEHQTIRALARYFAVAHADQLRSLLLKPELAREIKPAATVTELPSAPVPKPLATWSSPSVAAPVEPRSAGPLDIAIIGLSGRYPQARTIDALWRVLREGRDCITEVPADRWDWRDYYSEDPTHPKGHSSKWGGFIDDVDKFDPQFFNLSPKIAPYLDPQERLILEEAWKALEDAGYRRADLQDRSGGEAWSPVGVYLGAMYGEYQLFGAEASLSGQRLGFAGNLASIANRLSYVLNLHGPSMLVDTMCSSSLTCLHLACQDLAAGRTNYALAGGVNVTIHPNKYLMLSGGQFLSPGGRCESFGEGGAGYIPSEGVGVAVLKRLADAERDGDHIYGVIKATAVNHGGRTHGYSVPNPKAQERVIAEALRAGRIDPRSVSYIEAHGTGTKLGDPIEIAGLANAFGRGPRDRHCWIGSVKSNIGHCEAAAGIAGLTKVLLQMKHGLIAPSLHSRVLNPHIDFAATPFVVNQTLREWERPVIDGRTAPRIAGISSFGAGGANAHVLIEEYRAAPRATFVPAPVSTAPRVALVVLSAQTEERLTEVVRDLRDHLLERDDTTPDRLRNLAYTLQVGREPMTVRLGWVVTSIEELQERLNRFLRDPQTLTDGIRGRIDDDRTSVAASADDVRWPDAADAALDPATGIELLRAWTNGAEIDWTRLYGDHRPQRISLPTYPFARKRYWVELSERRSMSAPTPTATANAGAPALTVIEMKSRTRALAATSGGARVWSAVPAAKPSGIALSPLPAAPVSEPPPPAVTPPARIVAAPPEVAPEPRVAPKQSNGPALPTLETELLASLAKALFLEPHEISLDKPFLEMGLDSIVGVEWVNGLNRKYGLTIPANQVYEHPNLRQFARFVQLQFEVGEDAKSRPVLAVAAPAPATSARPAAAVPAPLPPPASPPAPSSPGPRPEPSPTSPTAASTSGRPAVENAKSTDIAIVGMSGQFPGGQTLDEFWALLQSGRTAFTDFPADRDWDLASLRHPLPGVTPVAVSQGAFLKDVDRFDPLFFQISPKEAATMDPGERLFLQESWNAIEDAGVVPAEISGRRWGVFCGNGGDYSLRLMEAVGYSPHVTLAQVPSRVSHCLNLTGPSQSVDAGCASALLAIAQACDHLVAGKCEAALAGGVFVHSTPNLIVSASQVELLAKNGTGGRAFDRSAGGMMPSEAAGVVVLKPLSAALAAGDRIYGVIEGWGNNHNGRTNGMVAPNVDAQAELFSDVYERYQVDPESITFVEANASGLPLADAAEVQALSRAFRKKTARRQFCALGSVENNIGHAFHASGMSHVMKVLLSLRHRQIPATLNVQEPNPALTLEETPFFINGETIPWPVAPGQRRRAAISSFGATGANVHVVLAEAPASNVAPPAALQAEKNGATPVLIPVSAKTETGLRQRCRDLNDYLQNRLSAEQGTLGQLAANLWRRRTPFAHRAAIVADSLPALQRALQDIAEGREPKDGLVGHTDGELRLRPSLTSLAQGRLDTLAAGRGGRDDLVVLADLFVQGVPFDLAGLFSPRELTPLSLPGYPFEKRRCWISPPAVSRLRRGDAQAIADRPSTAPVADGLDPLATVKEFLAELTGLSAAEIDPGSPLSAYGIDSLLGMRLLNRVNDRFGGGFDAMLLVKETVGGFAEAVGRRASATTSAPVVPASLAGGWARPAFIETLEWEVPTEAQDRAAGEKQLERLIGSGVGVWRKLGRLCFEYFARTQTPETLARLVTEPGALYSVLEDGRRYFPASDMQRFALHESEVNQRTSFNLCQGFWIDAPVNLPALHGAFNDLVQRHSIFRTGARRLGSHWLQVVHDRLPVECHEIQWVGIEAKEHFEAELAKFQRERIDQRFDVGRAPLLDVYVIHNGRSLGAVFFCAHHFHADGFTLYFFQQELHRRYLARLRPAPETLPALPAEYAHFALAQFSPERAVHDEYWRVQLQGARRPARLRDDPQNLDEGTDEKTGLVELEIPPVRLAELQAFNRQNRTTLTQLVTAAVATLLYRLTGRGHPIQLVFNLRDRTEYETVLGDFSSSVPLLIPVEAAWSWRDVLDSYARATLELQRHRHFDFSRLLQPGADGEAPGMLGDVALDSNDRDAFGEVTAFAERLIDLRMEDRRPVAPLLVCLVKTHGRMTIPFMYDRSRFSRRSVSLFAENVLLLLDEMLRDTGTPIDAATILPELARRLGSGERSGFPAR